MNKAKEFIIDTWGDIRNKVMTAYKCTICGFRNLYVWFPIIWKDRGWDHYFLLAMMEKKLTEMVKTFKAESAYMNNEETIRQIEEILPALKRLANDNYLHEEHEKLHEEYGDHEFKEIPGGMYQMVRWDDEKEEAYGTDRLLQRLNRTKEFSQERVLADVLQDIRNFAGSAEQFDDITMLGLTFLEEGQQSSCNGGGNAQPGGKQE